MLHCSNSLPIRISHTYNAKLQENKFREFARTTMIQQIPPVHVFCLQFRPVFQRKPASFVFTRATLARFIPPTTAPIRAPPSGHRAYRKEWGDNGTRPPPATRDRAPPWTYTYSFPDRWAWKRNAARQPVISWILPGARLASPPINVTNDSTSNATLRRRTCRSDRLRIRLLALNAPCPCASFWIV